MEDSKVPVGTASTVAVSPSTDSTVYIMTYLICPGSTLICMTCDPSGGFDKGTHAKDHTLLYVRRTYKEEEEETEEENKLPTVITEFDSKEDDKLAKVASTLSSLDDRLGALDVKLTERLDDMDRKVDLRLKSMEEKFAGIQSLLEKILEHRSTS